MKSLSKLRILLRLLRSVPLLLLLGVQLKTVELRERMKNKKEKEKEAKPELRKTERMGSSGSPSQRKKPAIMTMSPFELEAGKRAKPESPEEESLDGPSSIGSPGSDVVSIDPKVAGGLLELGFDIANDIVPEFPPLSEKELDQMSDPFAKFLVDQGWEDVAKSSIVFFARLGSVVYKHGRIAVAARKAKKRAEAEIKAGSGDRKAGPGQDVVSPASNPGGGGAGGPGIHP